jgi:SAM-dependent methyltransferase
LTGPGDTQDPLRRANPRIIDSDWLVMRGLSRAVAGIAERIGAPGLTAIDFGCGTMPYRPVFERAGCRYLGADVDGSPEIAIDAEGRMDAADASADIVASFQVLEHVRDLGRYFGEASRVLKPGGRMVLSTHGTWLYHAHPEDHRRWTREGLIYDIERHGFEVTECVPIVGPLGWTTVMRLTGFAYVLKKIPLVGAPIAALLALVMNARAWAEDAVTPMSITRDNACIYVTVATKTA